jgi:hypothetical protein
VTLFQQAIDWFKRIVFLAAMFGLELAFCMRTI